MDKIRFAIRRVSKGRWNYFSVRRDGGNIPQGFNHKVLTLVRLSAEDSHHKVGGWDMSRAGLNHAKCSLSRILEMYHFSLAPLPQERDVLVSLRLQRT